MCVNHFRFTVSSPTCGGSISGTELCIGVNKPWSVDGRLELVERLGSCAHSDIVDVIEKSSALTSKSSSRNHVPDSDRERASGDVSLPTGGTKPMELCWTRSDVLVFVDRCAVGLTTATEVISGTSCSDSAAEAGVSIAGSSVKCTEDGASETECCEPSWSP